MPLKAVLDNLDGLAEPVQSLYTKGQDNKFHLAVDGLIPAARLDEFRTNNIELKKALEKFEGVDIETYQKLVEQDRKLKEKKMIDAGDLEKVVEERVKALKADMEGSLQSVSKERDTLATKLSSVLIDSAVKSAAVSVGVVPTAVDDVVLRAKTTFQMKGGEVVAINGKGDVIYGKDGVTPMSIDEWVKDLKASAPHLFEGMRGGGAGGAGGRPGAGGDTSKLSATAKIAAGLAAGQGGG
jgi:hypothetical protein